MANEFSTAGIQVAWCAETTAGTRPTTNYNIIAGIKSTPDFNPEPNALEVTDLADKEYRRYVPSLKDVGGSLGFRANLTTDFLTNWRSVVSADETAFAAGKAIWWEIKIPEFESFYFAGRPTPLGVSAFEVDAVAEINAYVTPNEIHGWDTASTTTTL